MAIAVPLAIERLVLATALVAVAGIAVLRGRAAPLAGDRHRRGTRILGGFSPKRRGREEPGAITVAGQRLSRVDEVRHIKIIGTTGTGKSTAIRELLNAALRRGDRAVISDPDGGYLRRFIRPYRGDLVLNPFQPGSQAWNLFGELRADYDVEQLCEALISPSADASTQEWRGYARILLAALLRFCRGLRDPAVGELWRLLSTASVTELRGVLVGTPAQPFLEPENARMFSSIRSVASAALAPLEPIARQRSTPLAVRNWVRHGRGVLFMPYRAGQIAALRSLIAAWLRLAIFETMDGEEESDQRIWFVIDELDALGPIAGLKDALARLRKFGGRCVLGCQSIAQVSSMYGSGEAQALVENCGNTLILRCGGSEHGGTSQFAARLIGEREVIRLQHSRSHDGSRLFSRTGARSSRQLSEQRLLEQAVLASELEQLPDLCGYLKLTSTPSWRRVRLSHSRRGP